MVSPSLSNNEYLPFALWPSNNFFYEFTYVCTYVDMRMNACEYAYECGCD